MGALTDNRKRCFVDLCFPSPPPPPSSDTSPVPKKPKHNHQSQEGPVEEPPFRVDHPQFPPPAPLRRRVQGPQRTIRVFGLGNQGSRPEKETMGNLASRVAKKAELCPIWRGRRGKEEGRGDKDRGLDGGFSEEMRLEDYRRLVKEGSARSRGFVFPKTPDLRVLVAAEKEGEAANRNVVNRKVEEERTVTVELTPGSEEVRWTRSATTTTTTTTTTNTTPVYKDLLEETSRKYDSKLRNLDFEVKLAELEFKGFQLPQKEKPEDEEDLEEPFASLTDEEENVVNLALGNPTRSLRGNDILVMHEPSNIEITREIMQCLRYGAWLNDEVINLYLELLKEREKREPKKFLKCHFFNTFFFKKLTSGGCYDFKAVRRWTTQRKIGYSLIDCDKIFVPIHKEIHWCLAVINVKDKKFQYLDSLGGMDDEVLIVLARYLTDEAKDKNNTNIDAASWKREFVRGLPLQKNGWDCGMFMLKYTDFYSRGLVLRFGQENMSYFRRRTVKELLRLRAE